MKKRKLILPMLIACLLCGCGSAENKSVDGGIGNNLQSVEITEDNITDYFEEFEYSEWKTDSFGNVNAWFACRYLKLKDEYQDNVDPYASELVIKSNLTYARSDIDIDFENKTYQISKTSDGYEYMTEEESKGGYLFPDDANDEICFFGVRVGQINPRGEISIDVDYASDEYGFESLSDYEIIKATGTLVFK